MKHPILAPAVGESITEVTVATWKKHDGDMVQIGDVLLEVDSDKATVEIAAEHAGILKIDQEKGSTIAVGSILGSIETSLQATTTTKAETPKKAEPTTTPVTQEPIASPSVRKIAQQQHIDLQNITGSEKHGRITREDLSKPQPVEVIPQAPKLPLTSENKRPHHKETMSSLRQKIAERLLQSQQTAAILTTFNEVDLSAVMALRTEHKENFKKEFGVNLSFMSFFTRAATLALKNIPIINTSIDGKDIIYYDYCDIGIAVGTEKGLVVPVLRDAHLMTFGAIEQNITELATKARNRKLSIAEMSGGTFSISNGGTYGSLLSTPILNPPQSGILGMHKIQERPVAIQGAIAIRPMMYLALSYDHRIIDGKEAVTFLVNLKELLEQPEKLHLDFIKA